jgi:hypothetical protein
VPDELHGRNLSLYLQTAKRVKNQKQAKSEDNADRPSQTTTHTFQRKAGEATKRDARARLPATVKARQRVY